LCVCFVTVPKPNLCWWKPKKEGECRGTLWFWIKEHTGAVHMQCWKHFCYKKAIILACIEFKKFGIEILETNWKPWVGNFANRCGITKNLCWCRTFLWKREFVHLCGSAKCKVYYDHFGRDWLQRSGWTIGDASAEHESIFLRRGRSTTFQFHQTKPATCGYNPAGSKIENGIFSRREVDQAQLFLVQLVAAGRTERIKIKSLKRKESPMKGSHGVAADRKHKKTESGSTKAKYFAFLNEESSCSADN